MAISRSLMNRQLYANGGIMQVAPREKFGLGSSLKKFVRKIIPNEVADIAVKAAPFVAPFNPALAAGMAGIGSFDQTGSIGDSLKRGALTYGGGQAARYIGGAGFQGNPFGTGGAFTPSGFTQGFSSPIGTDTGLGKFFSNRGTEGVQGIDMATGGADGVGVIQDAPTSALANANELSYVPEPSIDMVTGGADGVGIIQDTVSENMLLPKVKPIIAGSPKQMTITESIQKILSPNSTMTERGGEALNLLKRTGKAAFTKEGKNGPVPDKAAILGAVAFAGSYAEARALAAETGIDPDLTEAEYDELAKAEKKEEYASYLTNFFGGKKDGGRIGYEQGANELMSDITMRGEMNIDDLGIRQQPSTVLVMIEGPSGVEIKEVLESDARRYNLNIVSDSAGSFADKESEIDFSSFGKKDGGRINRRFGSPKEGESEVGIMTIDVEAGDDEDEEDMKMAGITFSSAEKSYLFRRLAGPGGSDRSYTMPQLYKVLSNPDRYAADAAVLKEIAIMGLGKKDGGRIGLKDGTPDKKLEEILATDMTISNNPNDPRNMTTEEIIAVINSGRSTPELFEELLLRNTGGVNEIDMDEGQAFSFNERGATSDGGIENLLFKLRESNPDIYGDYNRPRKFLPTAGTNFYAKEPRADGGRIGFAFGSPDRKTDIEEELSVDTIYRPTDKPPMLEEMPGGDKMVGMGNTMKLFETPYGFDRDRFEFMYNEYLDSGKDIPLYDFAIEFLDMVKKDTPKSSITMAAKGGRIGLKSGSGSSNRVAQLILERDYLLSKDEDVSYIDAELESLGYKMRSEGGVMDVKMPTGQIRKNNAGVVERDYRDEGGFVPVGIKERADDVPAMLSKNEFVMTADAVRGIGNGSVEEGSKKLYNTMKQAEKVGKA